jgi:cellulose synthase (UDP-forming)
MIELYPWSVLLFTIGFFVTLFETLGRRSSLGRVAASVFCTALTIRYIRWRVLFTIPIHQNLLQRIWIFSFVTIEFSVLLSSMLVYFFMSRTISRTAEADARQNSPLQNAPTDVFIATYDEAQDIIERTMVGALALDHPDLRLWILDDGNRPWVRELAESLGVHYVFRDKGKHAKAGNVNNGVRIALNTGRRPEFFLLLDADFIPHRNLLRRVLGLFEDSSVGIVQTPQHFFNPDPVQSNLLCSAVWPDEQRFFFNVLLPCKDAWDAAFCCGTSAVFRTAAFVAADGMATETVTEDMLTSFRFREYGYRTILLNERLSLGLAPESLGAFISQRSRWCLGAIQQLFTRWSFFGRSRISFINRLAFFDSILYWMFGAAFKIMLALAPLLYWFTGTAAIHATISDLICWMAPMLVANLLYMYYLADNRILPIMTDITQLLTAFTICRTVVTALIRPFGRAFKVTSKGLSSSGITIQWRLLAPYAALAVLTLLGVLLHVAEFSPAHDSSGYSGYIFWSLINAIVLILAATACVELPHRRRDERFCTSEPATVRLASYSSGTIELPCTLKDISLGGAAILHPAYVEDGWRSLVGPAELIVYSQADGAELALPFTVVNRRDNMLTLHFRDDPWIRHALIRKLFTGAYHQDVETISATAVFSTLAHAMFL